MQGFGGTRSGANWLNWSQCVGIGTIDDRVVGMR